MHYYYRKSYKMESRIELKLDPKAQCVVCHSFADLGPVYRRVEDLMRILGYPLADIYAVQVALREAAANAIRHGNQLDQSKQVEVRYLVTQDEVVLEVEDEGAGFDPSQAPDLSSRRLGLSLMCAYMNWVGFNARGNGVTLARRRSEG
jgi:serine/threonine-protein kinase RsbW